MEAPRGMTAVACQIGVGVHAVHARNGEGAWSSGGDEEGDGRGEDERHGWVWPSWPWVLLLLRLRVGGIITG